MKRLLKIGGMLLCLLCLLSFGVQAEETTADYIEEQLEESGAVGLWDALDDETVALYQTIGVDTLADLGYAVFSPQDLMAVLGDSFAEVGKTPFSVLGLLLGAVVLCAYLGGIGDAAGGEVHGLYQTVGVLSVCTVTLIPFLQCVRAVQEALSGAAVFMGSFTPVYVTTLATSGHIRTALSYQTVVLLFSQGLTWLANGVLLPLLLTGFALGMVSSTTKTANLMKIGDTIFKVVGWVVGVGCAVFTALLAMNTTLGAAGETVGSRIAKLSLSSLVPMVGGALSEAFLTVRGCLGMVHTTVGAFGMITTALLLLPSLLQCVCWQLCLVVADTAADTFELSALGTFLKAMQKVTKTMMALLCSCGLFMLIGTAIVARGGAV